MYRATAGDCFVFPLIRGEFLSGRVLLDVAYQCIAPRRVKPDSNLGFFAGSMLLEIYGNPTREPRVDSSKILIPSLFLPVSVLMSGDWKVMAHEPVDPAVVDFPSALVLVGSQPHLSWGELLLPIEMTFEEFDKVGVNPTNHTSTLDLMCLVALGRQSEISPKRYRRPEGLQLCHSDLRASELGPDLNQRAGLPVHPNYFAEALSRGYDQRRFYEPSPLVPFLICPYCWSKRTPDDICWACGEDTGRDAAIERTQDELDHVERKTCPKCHERIPVQALRCLKCRTEQPEQDE
jgi:Immunity protein 26